MATFVIGDIQGCYDELRELLANIKFDQDKDTLWLVGDLINRGPKNVETLQYLMALPRVHTVLGNHDLHLLAVASGIRSTSQGDTISDLLESTRLDEFVDWLRKQPLIYSSVDQQYVMAHAGLPPIWDLSTCIKRAAEVEAVLCSDNYEQFLANMYGDEPAVWSDNLTGTDRLRVITNYFTRLRYCTADGRMELDTKANSAPEGYAPWFSFPRHNDETFTLVFGHWAAIEGHTGVQRFIALDTGCVWGRKLTAYHLETGKRYSVPGLGV
ncbi:MAG: symmetrical bis(5'-nucleosyl)-tetraphosphatase [Pseudomonadales bacterium]